VIFWTGLEDAFRGVAEVWCETGARYQHAVYSGDALVKMFTDDGMTEEEALEHIAFNIEGGYLGPDTPVVCWDMTLEDAVENAQ